MPSLGADMDAATLVEWVKKPGEDVHKGDIVAEVETDKGLIAIEAFVTGKLEKQLVAPGARVTVGTPMAEIRENGAVAGAVTVAATEPVTVTEPVTEIRAAPLARRRAKEMGIELSSIHGTGVHGTITVADVERARAPSAPTPAPAPAPAPTGKAAPGMRHVIAAAMARSKREIPHFYLSTTVDLGPALARLENRNATRGPAERVLPAVLLLRAAARAVAKVPELNARYENDRLELATDVNLGIAISLRDGLVAPAISNADRLGLDDFMRAFQDLVSRARSGGLRSSELYGGTITVTSLGDRGAESVLPIIFPPQVAMVGFGKIVRRPWVVDGLIGPRPVVTVTLAADHRACDGHRAGLYLAEIERLLTEPEAT
jgi:pyruvate dehydrogenase E2 component (dihydrolipoamide acetyltransferase)